LGESQEHKGSTWNSVGDGVRVGKRWSVSDGAVGEASDGGLAAKAAMASFLWLVHASSLPPPLL
jgi:hypothetical protein